MNPRLAAVAALGREVALPASVLAWIAVSGFAGIDKTGAAPIVDRLAPSLAADANTADLKFAGKLPSVASAAPEIVTASTSVTVASADDAMPATFAPAPVVAAVLTESAETLPPETTAQAKASEAGTTEAETTEAKTTEAKTTEASTKLASLEPGDTDQAAASPQATEACSATDACVDQYLWSLYQHTPKEDSVKIQQQRNVTVKRKGKLVSVTRTVSTVTDEDFSWKDPKAAENAVMPLTDYVIGGMDRDFKLRLFHLLHAAEDAGLSPGITSAFRDDFRQWIASGLKAANDRSYHGGSTRGGWGHGLAADIVSINGATRAERLMSSDKLWAWVDAHGKDYGIGRPYLDRDPPHVAPIDGKEYAAHHPGTRARHEASAAKPHARTARSSKVRTI